MFAKKEEKRLENYFIKKVRSNLKKNPQPEHGKEELVGAGAGLDDPGGLCKDKVHRKVEKVFQPGTKNQLHRRISN